MNLERYLQRLGFSGPTAPTRATLDALCLAHVRNVPFENLDVLLGRPIELSDEALERKIVGGRGGYCFELNGLFARLLRELGFECELLSARVRLNHPRELTPPRTHCFVRVVVDGVALLADVGVGGASATSSLRLDTQAEQPTPHDTRRLVREGERVFHQLRQGDAWTDVWESTLEPMPLIDREVANWYTSAHPRSHFRDTLMAARALDETGRIGLRDRQLTIRTPTEVRTRTIDDPDELIEVLATEFSLHVPAGTRFVGPRFDWPPGR